MNRKLVHLMLIWMFLLAACAPVFTGNFNPGSTPRPTDVNSPPGPINTDTPAVTATAVVPTETPAATPTRIPVDLTPAQRAAIQALSQKYNIAIDQIHLLKTEAMTWPTGCLGIVLPGVMCMKGPVEGFKLTLEANSQQFEYHTNQDGTSVIDAAQQLATLRLVVQGTDKAIRLVNPNIPLGPTYNPAFNGLLPSGDATGGTAYVLDFTNQAKAEAVNENGAQDLAFIHNPNYGLALWRGGPNVQPRLAWGTQPIGTEAASALMISNVDGTQLQTLLTQPATTTQSTQFVAEFWSADGQSLYFSKEPVGLGGYILFAGASNLYKIDITSQQVSELIPMVPAPGPMACLDAISGDYRFVADHCVAKTITIRELVTGKTTAIQPPAAVTDFRIVGSTRFSPDGTRLAFAIAKGDPNSEQGWVAVSDGTSGASKLILTGESGSYYTIAGWLSDQLLLVQSNSITCNPNCASTLWVVGIDGSNPTKVADGSLLAVMDNR